jgi:hypothetical protein
MNQIKKKKAKQNLGRVRFNLIMGKTNLQTIASLEQQIAAKKQKLQEAFDAVGCTDSIVLACSIKLDKLINRYQKKVQKMKAKDK